MEGLLPPPSPGSASRHIYGTPPKETVDRIWRPSRLRLWHYEGRRNRGPHRSSQRQDPGGPRTGNRGEPNEPHNYRRRVPGVSTTLRQSGGRHSPFHPAYPPYSPSSSLHLAAEKRGGSSTNPKPKRTSGPQAAEHEGPRWPTTKSRSKPPPSQQLGRRHLTNPGGK